MSDDPLSGPRFCIFNALDDFSREIPTIEVDTRLSAARIIREPDRITAWRGYRHGMVLAAVMRCKADLLTEGFFSG